MTLRDGPFEPGDIRMSRLQRHAANVNPGCLRFFNRFIEPELAAFA
jgi:hypothetical protein